MTDLLDVVVVGAGAWGLPAAAELADRGHRVTLVDRYGPANVWSSSPGPTRIWRLSHPDPVRVRLAQRSLESMQRLAASSGRTIFLRRGLLWRDDGTVGDVASSLRGEGAAATDVEPDEVGRFLGGLRPDGRRAVWQPDAGPVLAAESMAAQLERFERGDGRRRDGATVTAITSASAGLRVELDDGQVLGADSVVLAPGPGAAALLGGLGIELPLRPRLEQVAHVAHPGGTAVTDQMACWFDGPVGDRPGAYGMATPGVGYKIGLDVALRDWSVDDLDRTPDVELLGQLADRVSDALPELRAAPFDAQVCSWTESPDNRFVIDRDPDGVVLACGDGGEGFKFSALMGEVLADLAEGRSPDPDVASFGLARFERGIPEQPHVLGR